jgi:hypothetical protein
MRSELLRLELQEVFKKPISLKNWNEGNIKFYENHKYFTNSAKKLLQEKKNQIIKETKEMLKC